jgi:hypothetical protein
MKSPLLALPLIVFLLTSPAPAQAPEEVSPETMAARMAEWTETGDYGKLVDFFHPDDLAAFKKFILETSERLQPYGEPAPFEELGLSKAEVQSMPAKEFLSKILDAAAAQMRQQLADMKIRVTSKVTDKTETSALLNVRTEVQLSEAQKESMGVMAALVAAPNEETYRMKRADGRWYVQFDERLKAASEMAAAAVTDFEKRAARDRGRPAAKGPLELFEREGFRDALGRTVIDPTYTSTKDFSEGRGAVEVDSKWGFIDTTGRVVVEPRYEEVGDFIDGLATVKTDTDAWGVIDTEGRQVLAPTYEELGEFSGGLFPACKDGTWGFIDRAGSVVIPFQYTEASGFLDGKAQVSLEAKEGEEEEEVLIDRTGKVVGKASFEERMAAAMKVGLEKGMKQHARASKDGAVDVAAVVDFESFQVTGYRDASGRTVIEPRFAEGHDFTEGLAAVRFLSSWGFIDPTGRTVIKPAFSDARSFQSGRAAVEVDDEFWGFIDKAGRLVVKASFDDARDFSEGLAAVDKDGLWGYINASGTLVIPHRYADADDFENGQALVTTEDDEELVIDRTGKTVKVVEEEEDEGDEEDEEDEEDEDK